MDIVEWLSRVKHKWGVYCGYFAKPLDAAEREITHLREQVDAWRAECLDLQNKLAEATEWRPIDGARKDGEIIMRNKRGHIAVGEWITMKDPFSYTGWFPLQDATHFLPLPAAPTEKAGS